MAVAKPSSMQSLFGEEGMRRLEQFIQSGILCAFDFDGTLAPIVDRPDQAKLPAEIRLRLIALVDRAPVAVITGRSVPDIGMRLGFTPTYVVGNHGLEGVPGWTQRGDDYRALCRAWGRQLEQILHEPGIEIEDKFYSLSVHYRHALDPDSAASRLRARLAQLTPAPRIVDGKYVFNLLPENGANKGQAIERLIEISAAPGAIYVGDDITDEDVFRLRRSDVLSIRIDYAFNSAAQFFVPQHDGIVRLLDLIIRRFDVVLQRTQGKSHTVHN